ncbi:MAG: thioredoxin domain-containing protein, partial [Planctomycetota bacterium]
MKVQAKYGEKGLVIFAMYRGAGTHGAIGRVARLKKWNFPVYNEGTVTGYELGANPQIFIFNYSGKMVFDPKYGVDPEKKAEKYSAEAPDWLVGDRKFEHLKAKAKTIASHRNLGKVMEDLEKTVSSASGKEKEEAEYLVGRLKGYAEWRTKKAVQKYEDGYPS